MLSEQNFILNDLLCLQMNHHKDRSEGAPKMFITVSVTVALYTNIARWDPQNDSKS